MDLLDPYELRVRAAPAFIVLSPVIVTVLFLIFSIAQPLVPLISSGIVLLVVVYAVSLLVRYLGKRIEANIWDSWGGPPAFDEVSAVA